MSLRAVSGTREVKEVGDYSCPVGSGQSPVV